MTLSVAWLRKLGRTEELVFASDSRLRGGEAWDCCPKIIPLPRSDCLISFAGSTLRAYPLILQMARAIDLYPGSKSRRMDIADMKGHTLRVFEQMWQEIGDLPIGHASPEAPDTEFLFGGYSWRQSSFLLWRLHFDKSIGRFTYRPIHPWGGQESKSVKLVAFAGDAEADAMTALRSVLARRGKLQQGSLDMEPFEVLRDIIRDGKHASVGGAPQVAKVYRYMRSTAFAVLWPNREGRPHVYGRAALGYEEFDAPFLDPDAPSDHPFRSEY